MQVITSPWFAFLLAGLMALTETVNGHRRVRTANGRVKKSGNGAVSGDPSHNPFVHPPPMAAGAGHKERKPNIILILTDDQDVELGKCRTHIYTSRISRQEF